MCINMRTYMLVLSLLLIPCLFRIGNCTGFCNLGGLQGVETDMSSVYNYTHNPQISLSGERALDGKFHDHRHGDCGSTDINQYNSAWWKVRLMSSSKIYKLNLIFRDLFTRHTGFYLFINQQVKDVGDLTSLSAVYHELDPKASSQNVIMFPGGYRGIQIYLYLNITGEVILDLCEVEIIGCQLFDMICKCPPVAELSVDFLKTEIAFPQNNTITIQCYSYYIIMLNSSGPLDKCNFQRTCKEETNNLQSKSVSYICLEVCRDDAYNESTTDLLSPNNSSKAYYIKDENITLQCKYRHKLIVGHLARTCLGNLTWTGEKPVCQRCQCPCERLKSQNFITDPQVLEERIEEIKAKLEVEKAKLSSTIRQKTSASDERTSVQGIGMALGVGIITFILSIIICSDLPLLYRHIRYGPS